jgi:glucose/arabinose dehydrogenase
VDIASAMNAHPTDTTSNPVRSAIYQYDLDGANGKVFARGIRNAEGLAFVPGTNELWAAVNESDDVRYPVPE